MNKHGRSDDYLREKQEDYLVEMRAQQAESAFRPFRMIVLAVLLSGAVGAFLWLMNREVAIDCVAPLRPPTDCHATCDGACKDAIVGEDGEVLCMRCEIPEQEQARRLSDPCPAGSSRKLATCLQECGDGECLQAEQIEDVICYACFLCPQDTFRNEDECNDSCKTGSCDVIGSRDSVRCWQCF